MVGDGVARLVQRAFAARGTEADAAAVAGVLRRLRGARRRGDAPVPRRRRGAARSWRGGLAAGGLHQQAGGGGTGAAGARSAWTR